MCLRFSNVVCLINRLSFSKDSAQNITIVVLNFMKDKLIRLFARVLIQIHILKRMVVIKMDGGICSQMHFYLIGQYFVKRDCIVKYDLHWFEKCGKDLTGNYVRNFDLLKAFPYLQFEEVKEWERYFYTRLSAPTDATVYQLTSPVYMGGYYEGSEDLYSHMFPDSFHLCPEILDEDNRYLYDVIHSHVETVAIHIRRGDLAIYNGAYGNPVDTEYFVKAINSIGTEYTHLNCYLFSDEPQWIRQVLLPLLPSGNDYTVVDMNGSDKGYMDMYLISACKYQITSKGSLGKYGGLLNPSVSGKIIVFDDQVERYNWSNKHPKIIFLS